MTINTWRNRVLVHFIIASAGGWKSQRSGSNKGHRGHIYDLPSTCHSYFAHAKTAGTDETKSWPHDQIQPIRTQSHDTTQPIRIVTWI